MGSDSERMCASTRRSNPIHGFYLVEARTKNEENGHFSDVRFYLTKQEANRHQLLRATISLTDAHNRGNGWTASHLQGHNPEWAVISGGNFRPNRHFSQMKGKEAEQAKLST